MLSSREAERGVTRATGPKFCVDRRFLGGILLCLTLVVAGMLWRQALATGAIFRFPIEQASKILPTLHHPFLEFLKLLAAFLIGLLVTSVYRVGSREKVAGLSMEQAQVLLCVAGALMMIIIGDSLARAFGIAGGASIVRFRTPVEDPKDTIVLFLMLGLGMSCGVGAFALAGLGTAFVCGVLIWLKRQAEAKPRVMTLVLSAEGGDFPVAHVEGVLTRHHVHFETREASHGEQAGVRYRVWVPHDTLLGHLSEELKANDGATLKSVTWERLRKRDR